MKEQKFKFGAKSEKQEQFFASQFEKVKQAIEELILNDDSAAMLKWEKGWCNPRIPSNFCTGKNYTGIRNAAFLELVCNIMGYKSSQWAGKGQIKEKGGKIKEGEEGHPVFVPQMKTIEEMNEKTGKTEERKIFLGWSIYEVFNADQQEGAPYDASKPQQVWSESTDAEEILQVADGFIKYKEQEDAYYSPREDLIVLPIREQFKSVEAFYGTAFHEVVHWSGASTRLNRFDSSAVASFGSKNYSFEELVAEFGASMLKSRAGIDDGVPNAAAYIKSWWSRLESDMDELMKAYSIALKAVDYILNPPME